jgi:hypothetical protein
MPQRLKSRGIMRSVTITFTNNTTSLMMSLDDPSVLLLAQNQLHIIAPSANILSDSARPPLSASASGPFSIRDPSNAPFTVSRHGCIRVSPSPSSRLSSAFFHHHPRAAGGPQPSSLELREKRKRKRREAKAKAKRLTRRKPRRKRERKQDAPPPPGKAATSRKQKGKRKRKQGAPHIQSSGESKPRPP